MGNVVDGRDFLDTLLTDEPAPATRHTTSLGLAFTVKRFILGLLLDRAATVVPTRDVMEVLNNFQLDARPGRLRVIASDMEQSMIATTELVTVTEPGVIVFPAKKLLGIIREAEDGDVAFRVSAGTAHITIGRTTWTNRLQGGEDYPAMPEVTEVVMTAVDRTEFATALDAVRYAACKDVARASLMMIDIRDSKLTACDGSRFQQAAMCTFPFAFQLPIAAADRLLKLLAKSDVTEIGIGQSDHHLIFRLGADVFVVNKLMAQFPDMEASLLRPALANRHPLTVDRRELLVALKRTRINADPETSAIALRLAAGTVTVVARDKYGNDATETIDAGWTGPERTVVVNHQFLADLISAHHGQTLTLQLGDDTKTRKAPVMLRADTGAVGVVQQMHSDWVGAG